MFILLKGTLISLSAAPSAVRAAAAAYIKVLSRGSDNNVKLIVLERIGALRKRHAKVCYDIECTICDVSYAICFVQVMRELVMDILRTLSTPNTDIRRATLAVAMDLVVRALAKLVKYFLSTYLYTSSLRATWKR
jgi:coatomer subunit beta